MKLAAGELGHDVGRGAAVGDDAVHADVVAQVLAQGVDGR